VAGALVSRPTLGPNAIGVELKGGTSTTAALVAGLALVRLGFAWGGNERGSWGVGLARCWVLREQPFTGCCPWESPPGGGGCLRACLVRMNRSWVDRFGGRVLGVGAGEGGDRSLFENCTVDASIF